jgi:hypothetical protein
MSWDTAGAVAVAALSVAGASLQLVRVREGRRGAVKRDLEILALLPPESEAYSALSRHVQDRVIRSVRADESARRDPSGIAAALVCMSLGAILVPVAASSGGWWWLLGASGAFLALVGIYGSYESFPRRFRDAKGHRLPDADVGV